MPNRQFRIIFFLLSAGLPLCLAAACDGDDAVVPLPQDDATFADSPPVDVYDAGGDTADGDAKTSVECPPGGLDRTFGQGGISPPIFGSAYAANAYAMAIEPVTGNILLAGTARDPAGDTEVRSFALARFHPDGQPDTSFGKSGTVVTKLGATAGFDDVTYLPDGRIVAVGFVSQNNRLDCAIACYHPNGSLDTTFGGGTGIATVHIGTQCTATAVTAGSGSTIAVAAYADQVSSTNLAMTVFRLSSNGALDSTLADAGWVQSHVSANQDRASDLAIQPSGAIVLAGSLDAVPPSATSKGIVLRYDKNGKPDPGFGDAGFVMFPAGTLGAGIATGDGGPLYVTGFSPGGTTLLARLSADGGFDPGFADGGFARADGGPYTSFAMKRAAVQSDGKTVIAGWSQPTTLSTFLVPRFGADGALDTSFGSAGFAVGPVGTVGADIAIQSNGRILVAGTGRDPANKLEFFVAGLCP